MRTLLINLLLWVSIGIGRAAPLQRDLGQGLVYLRATSLPDDLSTKLDAPACVLDLRYAAGGDEATGALAAWLERHTAGRHLVFVLVNATTNPSALRVLSLHPERPGLLTLGPRRDDYTPDIVVSADPANEQRAYDALAAAKDPAGWLAPAPVKVRYDEAAIVKAMNEGLPVPEEEPAPDIAGMAEKPAPPPPLTDHTLQRAVQIHQAWLVLGSR